MKKLLKLNGFWLRIIALVTMTIDHIGVLLDFRKFFILRILGRISLPLFIFLSVEGALKTHNKKKYFIRILILLIFTSIALFVMPFFGSAFQQIAYTSGNIFFDLLFAILCVWILDSKNKKIKPLIALPVAYAIFSFIIVKLEGCACNGLYTWFPAFLRMQYSIYALILAIGFYYSHIISERYKNAEDIDSCFRVQFICNALCVAVLILTTVLMVGINYLFGPQYATFMDDIESYALLAGLFILCYNGARGYNAKWFRILSYIYYPLHIAIIALFCLA